MEKRVSGKVCEYIETFKNDIKTYLNNNNINLDYKEKSELLKFIFDYDNLELEKTDFTKRKRIKNIVPFSTRCMACRANGEQCTRKRKDDSEFCGTHDKNRPHGIVCQEETNVEKKLEKRSVWLQEITGILYYIDNNFNVYKTEDIMTNKVNPDIFAKYKIENDKYILLT